MVEEEEEGDGEKKGGVGFSSLFDWLTGDSGMVPEREEAVRDDKEGEP